MHTPDAVFEPVVQMQGICLSFGDTRALDTVDLDLHSGEIHALLGENGAGKSSLIKVLAGIYQASSGRISIRGQERQLSDVRAASACGIAVIHQELNLVDSLSVVDNIYLCREPRTALGLPDRAAMRNGAQAVLDALGFVADSGQTVGSLRMGEKQMVEIAKALIAQASVLIMDEPTSALSPAETAALHVQCRALRDRGLAIVLITHHLHEVFELADRITVLRDGKKVGSWLTPEVQSPQDLVSLMIGKKFAGTAAWQHAQTAGQGAGSLLSAEHLRLNRRARTVLDVSFSVGYGEVLGLSGLLGAGKTETLEALFGLSPYQRSGRILLHGQETNFTAPHQATAAGLALVTEDRKRDGLLLALDMEANFLLPNLQGLARYPLYHPGSARTQTEANAKHFNVRYHDIAQASGTLSGGNQQKLIIGKWLLRRPTLLLLDEPTRGVDTAAKADIYKLIREAVAAGTSVIIASSEIDELMLVCDRILVLYAGRESGTLTRSDFSVDALIQLAAAPAQAA